MYSTRAMFHHRAPRAVCASPTFQVRELSSRLCVVEGPPRSKLPVSRRTFRAASTGSGAGISIASRHGPSFPRYGSSMGRRSLVSSAGSSGAGIGSGVRRWLSSAAASTSASAGGKPPTPPSPASVPANPGKPITILDLNKKYKKGIKLSMVTAYDYSSARFSDHAGVDMLLVGDSVGMVVLGHKSTVPVTTEDIIHHSRAVRRGTRRSYVISDMPFGTYLTPNDAVHNAARLVQEGRCDAVKLEGGRKMVKQVKAIVDAGITVVGHIGLTPQTASSLGGYRVQGKSAAVAADLYHDALALQEVGCSMMIIECVPTKIAAYITSRLNVPTIGIGAGSGTSGQVQVFHDMVGMFDQFTPKFSKQYADLGSLVQKAVGEYVAEVENQEFPAQVHSFSMKDDQYEKFVAMVESSEEADDADATAAHWEHITSASSRRPSSAEQRKFAGADTSRQSDEDRTYRDLVAENPHESSRKSSASFSGFGRRMPTQNTFHASASASSASVGTDEASSNGQIPLYGGR